MNGVPSVHCPVCAVELSGPVEICTTCQTPHHADCAKFVGRCAVFGCGAYEFMAIDHAAAGYAVVATNLELTSSDDAAGAYGDGPRSGSHGDGSHSGTYGDGPRSSPGEAPQLGRSIPQRLAASAQLLIQNPGVSVPVGALLLVFSILPLVALHLFGPKAWLVAQLALMLGWLIGQAMTVIMLVSRAQGKDHTATQALQLAAERGPRVLLTGSASGVISTTPMIGGGLLAAIGLLHVNPWLVAAGSILCLYGFKRFVGYSLVTIVAAMGGDEEPQNALTRSTELVNMGRSQAALSVVGFLLLAVFVVPSLPGWLAVVVQEALALLSTAYWTLFYLETRRLHQRTFLPYAPAGYLPEAAPAPARRSAGGA